MYLFFFSSRRRHTRYWRDWSSDVCSSDLFFQPYSQQRVGLKAYGEGQNKEQCVGQFRTVEHQLAEKVMVGAGIGFCNLRVYGCVNATDKGDEGIVNLHAQATDGVERRAKEKVEQHALALCHQGCGHITEQTVTGKSRHLTEQRAVGNRPISRLLEIITAVNVVQNQVQSRWNYHEPSVNYEQRTGKKR